ncbi:MAG: UDP-N-acetylglucosamine 2-epimerase (non-hydrolyzing) [Bacteroidales bacterium]|nr:UDP-N-acetylglucosamine 2-epimerase (non-hydrolyzing) [Bacteroidales bacterium]
MITILTVIGARPQIIKAAALSRAIRQHFQEKIKEIIVHTGQHYDANMSQVFFDELGIPEPDFNLGAGSSSHGEQTAFMIAELEKVMLKTRPHAVILYGDTNSTLAGAVAASKIHIPVVHIEAGLRSFNKSMPEEINRIVCDHCSTLLFTPTLTGLKNLYAEGFSSQNKLPYSIDNPAVLHCGDVMYDNSLYFASVAAQKSKILSDYNLQSGKYILATIHRDNNTDIAERLQAIFNAFFQIVSENALDIILPLHPRTAGIIEERLGSVLYKKLQETEKIHILPPASFLDMIQLEKHSLMVMTDSGGVQKEAYFFEKPCIIMRSETEWKEIVEHNAGRVCDADTSRIVEAFVHFYNHPPEQWPLVFGDGNAAGFILQQILNSFGR